MAPLHRKAPGFHAACVLIVAAAISRLPVFPSIAMTRSFGGGDRGDAIAWGVHATSLADHLRYESSWASHRRVTAFLADTSHPLLMLVVATLVAHVLLSLARRLPRRIRAFGEETARRAAVWAYGVFGVVLVLRLLLALGVVRGPRPILLGLVGAVLLGILALASRDEGATWQRRAVGLVGTLTMGAPMITALLVLFAIFDGRHAAHVPWAWGLGAASFVVVQRVRARARRQGPRSTLR